jgi:hypothetical protein
MNKFLTRKEELKEIEEIQNPISFHNKINIILVFIHNFFYNSLLSGIYPLLFEYMKNDKSEDNNQGQNQEQSQTKLQYNFIFLIIASTYFFSYFSILFYHYFGIKRIKIAYIISYILFFISSLLYILSYQEENYKMIRDKTQIILLASSRILLGIGANPTMGRKYILTYAPKYFLPYISKLYVCVSIIGHSFGPFIGYIFFYEKDPFKCGLINNKYIYYTNFNCIGWYGLIFSLFLLILNSIIFTSPISKIFNQSRINGGRSKKERVQNTDNPFLIVDFEDSDDKEFYKLLKKKRKNNKCKRSLVITNEDDDLNLINSFTNTLPNINYNVNPCSVNNNSSIQDVLSLRINDNDIENFESINNYDINPIYMANSNNNIENNYADDKENGNFSHVNMIPRAIEDLIREEKKQFGYLNKNLLIILLTLFFENLIKENILAYCSYYVIDSRKSQSNVFKTKYLCCIISASYLLEILSIFFIMPLHKLNNRIKKLLLLFMILTIILMSPIIFTIPLDLYFIILSSVFLISSFIEVIISCYLAYLTPPDWKFHNIKAGALPFHIMTLGRLGGCLICLISFVKDTSANNYIIVPITCIGYGISGFYIYKSKNFRIKAIARLIRKSELETNAN